VCGGTYAFDDFASIRSILRRLLCALQLLQSLRLLELELLRSEVEVGRKVEKRVPT
jgi:hypothetical protein